LAAATVTPDAAAKHMLFASQDLSDKLLNGELEQVRKIDFHIRPMPIILKYRELFYIYYLNENNKNESSHKPEINSTMAFTRSLVAMSKIL
jgi:hypothetical protein